MARTALAATALTQAGIDPTDVDVAANLTDGNSFPAATHRLLYILNGDTTELTVTIPTPLTVGRGGLAVGDTTIVVPASEYRLAGPFGSEHRNADGSIYVNYAGADASVTVAVLDA